MAIAYDNQVELEGAPKSIGAMPDAEFVPNAYLQTRFFPTELEGFRDGDLARIQNILEVDDRLNLQYDLPFEEILALSPLEDDDRDELMLMRAFLHQKCQRVRKLAYYTRETRQLEQYIEARAKLAVVDVMLNSEVRKLAEISES